MQEKLWHDTAEDALRDVVTALGGPKATAAMLWPDKELSAGARYLNQCLDPDRAEKMELSQIVLLLKKGSELGCHTAMYFFTDAAGYERPKTVCPETERDRLQREFIKATGELQTLMRRLERVTNG